jgi:hypothetical protein
MVGDDLDRVGHVRGSCSIIAGPYPAGQSVHQHGVHIPARPQPGVRHRKLEKTLEEAIVDVIRRLGPKKLPLLPTHHTIEMMAKAATAVYEAVMEDHDERDNQPY